MVTLAPVHLTIVAKAPVPGRVKTRMLPSCSPTDAAELAAAALADTLETAVASAADQVQVALDGDPGEWLPPGVRVFGQCEGTLGERLAHIWEVIGAPGLQIGMDTPQLVVADLDDALDRVTSVRADAVLGPAWDGGWWAIGFSRHCPGAFGGVPMSRRDTGQRQLARLRELGLEVELLPTRRDADDVDDALAVAAERPGTRFAYAVERILRG